MEPPPFQEAPRCDVCKCSFTTFRRRHHCWCCGRTLCHEHSTHQVIGYAADHQPVSVDSECKCDMPPCICEAPAPFVDALPMQSKPPSVVSQAYPRPKKADPVVKNRALSLLIA